MSDEIFETIRTTVVKRMSLNYPSDNTDDKLAVAIIDETSKVVIEILKEYEKLTSSQKS